MDPKNQNQRPEPLEKRTLLAFHANEKTTSVCYIGTINLEQDSIFSVTDSKNPSIPKGDYVVKKGNPFHEYSSNSKDEILIRCYDLIKKA